MNTLPKPELDTAEKQPEVHDVLEVADLKKEIPKVRKPPKLDADADDIVPGYSNSDSWYEP